MFRPPLPSVPAAGAAKCDRAEPCSDDLRLGEAGAKMRIARYVAPVVRVAVQVGVFACRNRERKATARRRDTRKPRAIENRPRLPD